MSKLVKIGSGLVLIIGLSVGVVLVQQKQNIFTKAWSGIISNVEVLKSQLGLTPATPQEDTSGATESKRLFHNLLKLYPDAEVQNIDVPEVNVSGAAFLKFDEKVNKTFVYSRIQNLPRPVKGAVRLWLNKNINEFTPVGITEFLREENFQVSYSVFVRDGDLRTYQNLLFSYDTSLNIAAPEAVALSLKF